MGESLLFSEFLKLIVVAEQISGVTVCGPLPPTTFSGILNLTNIFFKLLTTQMAVLWQSSSILNDSEYKSVTNRYVWPPYSNRSVPTTCYSDPGMS